MAKNLRTKKEEMCRYIYIRILALMYFVSCHMCTTRDGSEAPLPCESTLHDLNTYPQT